MLENFTLKQKVAAGSMLIALVLAWGIGSAVTKLGKTPIMVKVAPSDSQITLDGKHGHAGKLYLKPGNHVFVAKRSGFDDAKASLDVTKSSDTVILLPNPNSSEATVFLAKHPKEQALREGLGGELANKKGTTVYNNNPILSKLPATGVVQGGYYRIDVGIPVQGSSEPAIYITANSPLSRSFALNYIQTLGYSPADMDIVFNNLVTGFSQGDTVHHE